MHKIVFGSQLDHVAVSQHAAAFTIALDAQLGIDLNGVTFARPCGIAALAAWIERLLRNNIQVSLSAEKSGSFDYMQNMNLFKVFNIFEGEDFNRHPQTGRFARMMRVDWQSDATWIARELRNSLQVEDARIGGELFSCLEEALTNLWAHAAAPGFAIAQAYQRGKTNCWYEIAIVDSGKGIRAGLLENPDYQGKIRDDGVAVDNACQRGISGAIYRYRNDQQHFGLGLHQIDRIVESTRGEFMLYSGNACRKRQAFLVSINATDFWQGTMVLLKLTQEGLAHPIIHPQGLGVLHFG